MERLRKFGIWCWDAKERVVLTLMVLILGFRVYDLVIEDPDPDNEITLRPPIRPFDAPVDPPPPQPKGIDPVPIRPLIIRDPFVFNPGRGSNSSDAADAEGRKLTLRRIMPDGRGGFKAQILSGASRKSFSEGESFESYTVMTIDPDNECVEIYSENTAKTFELCIE